MNGSRVYDRFREGPQAHEDLAAYCMADVRALRQCWYRMMYPEGPEPEEVYVRRVLPDKIRLAKKYVHHSSFRTDLGLVFLTLGRMFRFESSGQRDARAAAKSISDGNSGGHLVEGACPPVQGEML